MAEAAINESSDRRTMGLPDHHAAARFESPAGAFAALAGSPPHDLVAVIENPKSSLNERVAAGQLLALVGDPRIKPFDPPMVAVPGGQVVVGLETERAAGVAAGLVRVGVLPEWIAKECPAHGRALKSYRIGKYPVTNLEYREFLADTRFPEFPTGWEFGRYPHEKSNAPVYSVTEDAADTYAAWLAARTGRRFRLPTEAEWEYAAAGPERREYPWGEVFDPDRANTVESGLLFATPVGAFPAGDSPFGASDMGGNVEEFVADDYAPYPGAAVVEDDLARVRGAYRVARGGSFTRFHDLARCKRRHGYFPKAIYVMGFRLAEDV